MSSEAGGSDAGQLAVGDLRTTSIAIEHIEVNGHARVHIGNNEETRQQRPTYLGIFLTMIGANLITPYCQAVLDLISSRLYLLRHYYTLLTNFLTEIVANFIMPHCRATVYVTSQPSPNVRGTFDIFLTCLATIFFCAYSVVHMNVPALGARDGEE